MLVEAANLKVGDEIIISCNSSLRYLKVIRPPKLRKRPQARGGKYTNAWCSSKIDKVVTQVPWGTTSYTRKQIVRACAPPEEHNIERYENLNYRTIWLVKRERK